MNNSEIGDKADFNLVRYAQCWEDADILLQALDIKKDDTCLSIASAGDNALAMLTCNPAKVIAIDLSASQLECLALRVAAYRHLSHVELLELIGSTPSNRRKILLEKCLPSLTPKTIDFWQSRTKDVEKTGIAGVGKFERYFAIFRDYILPFVHSKNIVNRLLKDKSIEERRQFFDYIWNTWRWRFMLKLFFSRSIMGKYGRDDSFFEYAKGSLSDQVANRTRHALCELNPSDNPYLQWILTGEHKTALPVALRRENFTIIRDNLDKLEWRQQSIEVFVRSGQKVNAFNLSDIFEYMSPQSFTDLYGKLLESAAPKARLAYWNMLVPRSAPKSFQDKVTRLSTLADDLFQKDKAFFYSRFVIEQTV